MLAALVVITGVPWSEVHAHEDPPARHQDGALPAPVESRHGDVPQNGNQHVHENGLFAQCPGVLAPETEISIRGAAAVAFPEPSIPRLRSHTAPPLRPPARF